MSPINKASLIPMPWDATCGLKLRYAAKILASLLAARILAHFACAPRWVHLLTDALIGVSAILLALAAGDVPFGHYGLLILAANALVGVALILDTAFSAQSAHRGGGRWLHLMLHVVGATVTLKSFATDSGNRTTHRRG